MKTDREKYEFFKKETLKTMYKLYLEHEILEPNFSLDLEIVSTKDRVGANMICAPRNKTSFNDFVSNLNLHLYERLEDAEKQSNSVIKNICFSTPITNKNGQKAYLLCFEEGSTGKNEVIVVDFTDTGMHYINSNNEKKKVFDTVENVIDESDSDFSKYVFFSNIISKLRS